MVRRSAASSASAIFSSAFARFPGPTGNSSMPRGELIRWRPRSRKTRRSFPTSGRRFEAHRHSLELGFATVFVLLALTMLFSAIWLGLAFANRLVRPIRGLIRAADEVASGNLQVQVPTRRSDGDLGHLGETFNKMTSELLRQQTGLIDANALNDERRAFIEAVLSGVPAGVLGVDNDGIITISNAAADRLLGGEHGLIGSLSTRSSRALDPFGSRLDRSAAASSRAGDRVTGWPRARSQRSGYRESWARWSRQRHYA